MARMKWYRVVLDEAQFIRNRYVVIIQLFCLATELMLAYFRATRASKVVAQLRAKYRWMLTGTPVTNTLYALQFWWLRNVIANNLMVIEPICLG
jgi:SNF2 family DNA or RNA helicase